MKENVIEFLKGEETATCTFCQGRFITKVKRLAAKYPDLVKITFENPDGSIVATLPVKAIKLNIIDTSGRDFSNIGFLRKKVQEE